MYVNRVAKTPVCCVSLIAPHTLPFKAGFLHQYAASLFCLKGTKLV